MKNKKSVVSTQEALELNFFEAKALLGRAERQLAWLQKPGNEFALESRVRFWASLSAKLRLFVVNHPEYQDWNSDAERELQRVSARKPVTKTSYNK